MLLASLRYILVDPRHDRKDTHHRQPSRIMPSALRGRRGYTLATRVAGSDHGPVSLPRTGRTIILCCWPGVRPLMTYSEFKI